MKWPNDVRIDGRKIAGILIETASSGAGLAYALVGIGVNVNFDPADHPEIADLATSIRRETGRPVDRSAVLVALLARFDDLYAEGAARNFAHAALGRHARNAGPPGAPELAGQHCGGTRRVGG